MRKSEQPEDVLVMVLVLQKALRQSEQYQGVAAVVQCMSDWAESLMTGGDINMNADHWRTVIGESK